jgi:hypothetical protein
MKKHQKPAKAKARKRRTTKSAARPRTFEQVRAANLADPFHAARIARLNMSERFDDRAHDFRLSSSLSASRISSRCFSKARRLPSRAWSIDCAASMSWPSRHSCSMTSRCRAMWRALGDVPIGLV